MDIAVITLIWLIIWVVVLMKHLSTLRQGNEALELEVKTLKEALSFFMVTYRDSNPRTFSGNNTGIFQPGDSVDNPPVYDPTLLDFTTRHKYEGFVQSLSS